MKPLAYQYHRFLLDETDVYITKKLKQLAKDKAKTRGQQQIKRVKTLLERCPQPDCIVFATAYQTQPQEQEEVLHTHVQVTENQTQHLKEVPPILHWDQSNPEELDRSLNTCS